MAVVEKILEEALALPRQDRRKLAAALVHSFKPENEATPAETEWRAAWIAENDRRLRDFDEGLVPEVPYEVAMAELRARFIKP